MSKERIACCVILYHPANDVFSNIASYASFVNKLYVFDNSEDESLLKQQILSLENVQYYHDGQNKGIASRLNQACEMAINDGYDWLLTMDQDSCFSEEQITTYFECFHHFKEKERVIMFGTVVNSETKTKGDCSVIDTDELITSGTLLNLQLYKKTGPFDEQLFIDLVDHDYCIRSKLSGYRIKQFLNVSLNHSLGETVHRASIKTLFLVKKRKSVHSPFRLYYMQRNLLYLKKKYRNVDVPLLRILDKRVTEGIQKNLLYGRSFLSTLKYILQAYRDFKRGKMGKVG